MITRIKSLLVEDEGLEMVEYALIIAVIALVTIVGYAAIGNSVKNRLTAADTELTKAR